MKNIFVFVYIVLAIAGSGCATIVQGSKQIVLFDTKPSGATCTILREGKVLYDRVTTPVSLEIEKDKDYLDITCEKEGYKSANITTDSTFEGWGLGNILLGGIIGVGVDAASGALNEYPSQVLIPLELE